MAAYKRLLISIAVVATLAVQGCLDSSGPAPSDPDNDDPASEPFTHNQNPGMAASDFLADSNFTELVVEVDYMEGYAPNTEALESLESFLNQRLNKATVTILDPTVVPSGNQDSYSADDIRNLEGEYRDEITETTEDTQLSAYMLIVDGTFTQNSVMGIAYYNTSSAFFGAAYDEASGGLGQTSRFLIEAVSYRHEFGHLFGLVNLLGSGTEMQQDHQDEENGHHCDNDQCLMYYAMETTDLFGQFTGDEIPPLDQNCLDDLQANGGR